MSLKHHPCPDTHLLDKCAVHVFFAGRSARNVRACRGITLIELMLVVVLMIIIMGVSGAAFTGMTRGTSERAAISQITSTLALCRQYAITRRETIKFHYGFDSEEARANYVVKDEENRIITEAFLPAGQFFDTVTAIHNPIEFRSDGTLSVGAITVHLYVTNSAAPGEKSDISINGLTGLVRVESP